MCQFLAALLPWSPIDLGWFANDCHAVVCQVQADDAPPRRRFFRKVAARPEQARASWDDGALRKQRKVVKQCKQVPSMVF